MLNDYFSLKIGEVSSELPTSYCLSYCIRMSTTGSQDSLWPRFFLTCSEEKWAWLRGYSQGVQLVPTMCSSVSLGVSVLCSHTGGWLHPHSSHVAQLLFPKLGPTAAVSRTTCYRGWFEYTIGLPSLAQWASDTGSYPVFISGQVNWDAEQECFQTFAYECSCFYRIQHDPFLIDGSEGKRGGDEEGGREEGGREEEESSSQAASQDPETARQREGAVQVCVQVLCHRLGLVLVRHFVPLLAGSWRQNVA